MQHKELRSSAPLQANGRTVTGTIPYNSVASIGGQFNEQIAPGAFASAFKPDAEVLALRDHRITQLMGKKSSGTLVLEDTPTELRFTVELPDSPSGNDLLKAIERRDISGTSFGFGVNPGGQKWNRTKNLRTLTDVHLIEVTFSALPAYPDSTIALRSRDEDIHDDEPLNKLFTFLAARMGR